MFNKVVNYLITYLKDKVRKDLEDPMFWHYFIAILILWATSDYLLYWRYLS